MHKLSLIFKAIIDPLLYDFFGKVAVRVRPLNGAEFEDKNCTEIVHVLDENVSIYSTFYKCKDYLQ